MATNKIQDGNVLYLTLASAVVSGGMVVQGKLVGIAETAGEVGDEIAVSVTGVYEVPKTSSIAFSVGDYAYAKSDGTGVNATDTNAIAGKVVEAAGNPSDFVKILLGS